jgi:hypothetical protein
MQLPLQYQTAGLGSLTIPVLRSRFLISTLEQVEEVLLFLVLSGFLKIMSGG